MILYLKKLRIILLLSLIVVIRVYYLTNNNIYKTKYKDEKKITGLVNTYKIDGNKLSIELIGKEKIIVNYYFETLKEKQNFKINLGDKLNIEGELKTPDNNRNFNAFNYNKYLKSKKINYIFNASKISIIEKNKSIKYNIKQLIVKRINKINNNYLYTFILGDTGYLDSNIKSTYRNNGISHLFAVSGMHITLLSGVILKLLNKKINNKYVNNIIVIIFLIFYMFLTNFTPSVIRATFLFIGLSSSKMFNLKIKPLEVILIILNLMLLYNPYYICNVGFILSFLVSISLIIYSKIINNYHNYIIKILITSLISFLISIPIMINNYNEINLLSPILNIIFVPFISLIIFPFSLIVFFIPYLNPILNFIIDIEENLSLLFGSIKSFTIILKTVNYKIFIMYYIFIIYIINKIKLKKYYYLLLLIIVLIIHNNINYLNKYPVITMIDIGQGDSILIELPNNKGNILIDTGGIENYIENWQKKKDEYSLAKSTIIPYLKSIGIKQIDYLVLTHGDADHMKESINLVNNFKIINILMNSGRNNNLEEYLIRSINNINYMNISKYELNIDKYKFLFINDKDLTNENEDSLITQTNLNGYNIIFMGDAGNTSEEYLINAYNLEKMDILKVGHHGSRYSTSEQFLKKINPKYALISAGRNNKFNHPNKETITKLKKYHIKCFITSIKGMIRVVLKNKIEFYTCL